VANAEHNHQVRNLDDLRVVQAIADGGPSLKRVQPRAMGRAFFIKHRTSHLTIAVSDEVNGTRGVLTRPRHMQVRRLPATAPATTTAPAAPAAKARPGRTSSVSPRGKSRTKPREKK
jgi:Ribosomal protein L22p/L17e